MPRRTTELEESAELARRINRWPALRNKPGDEKVYEFTRAVQELYNNIRSNTVEIAAGLDDLAPLANQIKQVEGGGTLFDEARELVRCLENVRARWR